MYVGDFMLFKSRDGFSYVCMCILISVAHCQQCSHKERQFGEACCFSEIATIARSKKVCTCMCVLL